MSEKKRLMPKFTKPPESLVALFSRAIGRLPGVEPREMFGYPAAFVKGNMFSSLFQSCMILRLSEGDRALCGEQHGAKLFEPIPGRPMREYIAVPYELLRSAKLLDSWLRKSHEFTSSLPPKGKKVKARKR